MSDDPFERAAERIKANDQRQREEARRERDEARERVRGWGRKAFRIHAGVFVATQLLLFAIWLSVALTAQVWFPWFVFPLLGWGIGLVAHYVVVRPSGSSSPRPS